MFLKLAFLLRIRKSVSRGLKVISRVNRSTRMSPILATTDLQNRAALSFDAIASTRTNCPHGLNGKLSLALLFMVTRFQFVLISLHSKYLQYHSTSKNYEQRFLSASEK
ncbi:hypothetical protein AVEN_53471-1 [Araneus ventricosus]|uniref:Uncharacterized protein n=1 Tax=Araneus ventricosus TaxID=182803 RepID=A0A4Y2AAL5_ARAVE|nr:hypothetical protein AVEN_53471-1 [Araneus ventricosus]